MSGVRTVAVSVIAALMVTVIGVDRPVGAVDGRPVDAAREVAVRATADGAALVVDWELWRGTASAYEAVDSWVVTAPGADEVVVPGSSTRAELEGLDAEDPHVVTVTGRNDEGDGPPATGTFDPDATPPGEVVDVDVRPTATSGQLLVSWTAPLADPAFDLVRVTWPGGAEDVLAADPQGLTIDGLTDGQPALVTARARSVDGWGPLVLADRMAPATPLLAPPDVTAEATGEPGEVVVTWGAPTPGGEGLSPVEGYEVTWSGGGHVTVPGAGARTTTLTGLVDGRPYDVRVASRNGAGPGVRATVADVVPSGPPTAAPADLTATATGVAGQVQLDWADIDPEGDGGSAITAFLVEGGGQSFEVTTPEQALVEGLTDGQPVELSVRAVNANGSGPAATAEAVPSGPPTAAPGWVAVLPTSTSGTLEVSWALVAEDGGSPITGYEVLWGEHSSVVEAGTGWTQATTISPTVDGERTAVTVRAVNANGPGPSSGAGAGATSGVPLDHPGDVAVAPLSPTSVDVTWAPVPTDRHGPSPVTGYHVSWNDGVRTVELDVPVGTEHVALADLVVGRVHSVSVWAVNEHGSSPGGSYTAFTMGAPLAAPTGVSAASTGTSGEIEVSWDAPVGAAYGDVTDVVVRSSTGAEVVVPAPATSIVLTGQDDGQPQQLTVRARTVHGAGPESAPTDWVAPATPPTQAPTVELAPRPGRVEVTWSQVWGDGGRPITGYRVSWESEDDEGEELVEGTATGFTIDGLEDGVPVTVTVAAVNVHGAGVASAPATVAPGQPPTAAPADVEVTPTDGGESLLITWTPIAEGEWGEGATRRYQVRWDDQVALVTGATSWTIAVERGRTYEIRVRAVTDEVGAGPWSETEWVWVEDPPQLTPTGVVARPTATPGQVRVQWNPGDGGPWQPADATWVVSWGTGSVEVPRGTTSTAIGGLPTDAPVTFRVRARSAWGDGPLSAPSAPVVAHGIPRRPNLLAVPTADLERDDTGWVAMGAVATRTDEVAVDGVASLQLAPTDPVGEIAAVSDPVAVEGGRAHVASARVELGEGVRAAMYVLWVDTDGVMVGMTGPGDIADGEGWVEVSVADAAPAAATAARLYVMFGAEETQNTSFLDGAVLALDEEGAPNLLTAGQAGFEQGGVEWTAAFARPSRSSAAAAPPGHASLRVELDGRHDPGAGRSASVTSGRHLLGTLPSDGAVSSSLQVSGDGDVVPFLTFVDAAGVVVSIVTGEEVALAAEGWTNVPMTATAPAGAVAVALGVTFSGDPGDVYDLDRAAVRSGSGPDAGPNLLPADEASFETDELGWTASAGAVGRSVEASRQGMVSLVARGAAPRITTDQGTAGSPVLPDHQYTASAWVRTGSSGAGATPEIRWFDEDGEEIDRSTAEEPVATDADWRPVAITGVAPAGAAYVAFALALEGGGEDVHHIDDVAICLGSSPDCQPDVPPAVRPTDVVLSPGDDGALEVAWSLDEADRVAEAVTGFRIRWEGGELVVTDPDAVTATVSGLAPEVVTFHVAAVNAHGEGPATRATRPGPPTAAPTEVYAAGTGRSGQIEVEWAAVDPADDGGSPIVEYRVVVGHQTYTTTGTRIVVDWQTDGSWRDVSVRAVNAFGAGPATAVRARPVGRPDPVEDLVVRATPTPGQVVVTWRRSSWPSGGEITRYEVAVGDRRQTVGPGTFTATIDDLVDGAKVEVRVRAYNAYGPGRARVVLVTPGVPIGKVTDLTNDALSATSSRVRWTPLAGPAEGVAPVLRHVVSVWGPENWYDDPVEHVVEVGTDELVLDGLTPGDEYRVEVRPENANGRAAEVAVTYISVGYPTAAPEVEAVGRTGAIDVSWTVPEGRGAATQVVVWAVGLAPVVLPITATTTTLTGVHRMPGNEVVAWLRSPLGDGPVSDVVAVDTGGPPASAPVVAVQPRSEAVDVSWTTPVDDGGGPITGYRVAWTSASGSGDELVGPSVHQLTVDDLDHDEEVTVTVRAVNDHGDGPASQAVTRTPGAPGTPPRAPVTGLLVLPASAPDERVLVWEPLDEDDWGTGTERTYAVTWRDVTTVLPATETSFVLEDVTPGTDAPVTVQPGTEVGVGEVRSASVSRGYPPYRYVSGLIARATSVPGRVEVEWNGRFGDGIAWDFGEDEVWVVSWPGGSLEVPRSARGAVVDGLPTDVFVTIEVAASDGGELGPVRAAAPVRADGDGRRPDLLTPVQSAFETSGWKGVSGVVSRSSDTARSGLTSLRVPSIEQQTTTLYDGGTGGLAVAGGVEHELSAWLSGGPGGSPDEARVSILWFDADERLLDAAAGPAVAGGPGWTQATLVATAPSAAVRALLLVSTRSTPRAVVYVDDVVFAPTAPGSPNLLSEVESGFESGQLGWSSRGGAVRRSADDGAHGGVTALRVVVDGGEGGSGASTDPVALGPLGPDRSVTASLWGRAPEDEAVGEATLSFLDTAGAVIETHVGTPATVGSGWVELTVEAEAPPAATAVVVGAVVDGEAGAVRLLDDAAIAPTGAATGTNLLPAAVAGLESGGLGWIGRRADLWSVYPFSTTFWPQSIVALAEGPGPAMTTDLGTAGIPVVPDRQYTASAWYATFFGGRPGRVTITWFDAAGAEIGHADGDAVSGEEVRASVTAVAPPGAAFAAMAVTSPSARAGEPFVVDRPAFCTGASPDCLRSNPPAFRPSEVTATPTATPGSVDLAWAVDPALRTSERVTGYRIRWAGGELLVDDPATTTATVTGLDEVGPLDLHVAAVNDDGEGPAATVTVDVDLPAAPPSAPRGLVATASAQAPGAVDVSWAPPEPGDGPITDYVVRWGEAVGATTTVAGTETGVVLTGLPPGTRHPISVAARNAHGRGPLSRVQVVDIDAGCAPPTASGRAQAVLADGAAAYYRLAELAATPVGATVRDEVGCRSGDVGAPTAAGSRPVTIPLDGLGGDLAAVELWVQASSAGVIALDLPGGGLRLEGGEDEDGAVVVPDPASWHHLVLTADGDDLLATVDGEAVLVGEDPWTTSWAPADHERGLLRLVEGRFEGLALHTEPLSGAAIARHRQAAGLVDTSTTLQVPAGELSASTATTVVATVTAATGTPAGDVVLLDGGAEIARAALVGGSAALDVVVGPGAHELVAVYEGSPTMVASRSARVLRSAGGEVTTTSVSLGDPRTPYGDPPGVEVVVEDADGDPVAGPVEVWVDGRLHATGTADGAGEATIALRPLPPGQHTVTAMARPSGDHRPSVGTTRWDVDPGTVAVEEATGTLAFRIAPVGGGVVPSGTVEVVVAGQVVGTAALVSATGPDGAPVAEVRLPPPALPGGSQQVEVRYRGDGRYAPHAWRHTYEVEHSVVLEPVDPGPYVAPRQVAVRAHVRTNGEPVTGTASLYLDGAPFGSRSVVAGEALLTVNLNTSGTLRVELGYMGVRSDPLALFAAERAQIVLDAATIDHHAPLTGLVRAGTGARAPARSGSVTVGPLEGGGDPVPVPVGEDGRFSAPTDGLSPASALVVAYQPDEPVPTVEHPLLASAPLPFTMRRAVATIQLTDVPTTTMAGDGFTFTATVAAAGSTVGGVVSARWDNATTPFASAPVVGGAAHLVAPGRPVGDHVLRVSFAGTAHVAPAQVAVPVRVEQIVDTSVRIDAEPSAATDVDAPLTVAVTVSRPSVPGLAPPTGQVEISLDGVVVDTPDLSGSSSVVRLTLDPESAGGRLAQAGRHVLSARYLGDERHRPSAGDLGIRRTVAPTVTMTGLAPTAVYGSVPTVEVSVTGPDGTPATEGTVALQWDGASSFGATEDVPLDPDGSTTVAIEDWWGETGGYDLWASYSGSANLRWGSSAPQWHVVTPAPTTVVLTSPTVIEDGHAVARAPMALRAQVSTPDPPFGELPWGEVTFRADGVVIGTVEASSGEAWLVVDAPRTAGDIDFSATFRSEGYFSSSMGTATFPVAPAVTTTTVAPQQRPVEVGESMDLVATVAVGDEPIPGGTVTFMEGTTTLGTTTTDDDGVARLPVSRPTGPHPIRATYAGGPSLAPSTSAVEEHWVARRTTITMTPITTTHVYGDVTTFRVGVAYETGTGLPTGTVRLVSGSQQGTPVTLGVDGTALVSLELPAGRSPVRARYSGDSRTAPALSESVDVLVAPRTLEVRLAVQPPTTVWGSQVIFTATVLSSGGVTPSGKVTLHDQDGRVVGGERPLGPSGIATFYVKRLAVGAHQIHARYAGTADIAPSRSTARPVTVTAANPVFVVNAPQYLREEGVAEIDVKVAAPGGDPARGQVQLWSADAEPAQLDTATLDDQGRATFRCSAAGAATTLPCGGLTGSFGYKIVTPVATDGISAGESTRHTITIQPGGQATVTPPAPLPVGFTDQRMVVGITVASGGSHDPEGTVTLLGPDGVELGRNGIGADGRSPVGFVPKVAGPLEVRASYSGDEVLAPELSDPFTLDIRETPKIELSQGLGTFAAGGESQAVVLRLRRPGGAPLVAPEGGIELTLSSTSRSTVVSSSELVDPSTIVVPEGLSEIDLQVTGTSAGDHQLMVRADDVGIRSWQLFPFTVTKLPKSVIVPVNRTVSAPTGEYAPAIAVVGSDAHGNSWGPVTTGLTFEMEDGECTPGGACKAYVAGDHEITISEGPLTTTAVLHANRAPIAEILEVRPSPGEARELTFVLRATDPDPADRLAMTYGVFWGDGTGSTEILPVPPDGETFEITHSFDDDRSADVTFKVTDGKAIAYDLHSVPRVEDAVLVAHAGDDRVARVGDPVSFDGSGSVPQSLDLTYEWRFGDGTESSAKAPDHVYTEPGQYLVELRVDAPGRAESGAATAVVTVTGADGSGVYFRVQDHRGDLVDQAAIVVNTADGVAHRAVGQPNQPGYYVLTGLPLGEHSAYVYKQGFAPVVLGFEVTGGADPVPVELVPGEAARATLTTRRLTFDEAVELGVVPSSTDAEVVHQYEVWLPKRSRPVTLYKADRQIVCPTDDEDLIPDDPDGAPVDQLVGDCGEFSIRDMPGVSISVQRDTVVVMNKTRAAWAKEVFEVTLEVFNISPTGFTLEGTAGTLNLPDDGGLVLADMQFGTQSPTIDIGHIPAGESRKAQWYLQGERQGSYDLSADVTAILEPVGESISIRAQTDAANRIHVWGPSALQVSLETDATAEAGAPYRQRMRVVNVADVPIYNLVLGVDVGRDGDQVAVLTQPRQEDALHQGALAAGAEVSSPEARLLYDATTLAGGDRLPDVVYARTGVGAVPVAVTRHNDGPRLDAPEITAGDGGYALGGATLSWDPVPGADRYAVFVTKDHRTAFPTEPIAETAGDETTVELPAQAGYGLVAVTAVFAPPPPVDEGAPQEPDVYEMSHRLLAAGDLPDPDPEGVRADDPCRGFGTDPLTAYPGNFAMAAADVSVSSIGLPLGIRRTYNSFDPRSGGAGRGWTVDLGPRGFEDVDGYTALLLGDGSCLPITEGSGGALVIDGRRERWTGQELTDGTTTVWDHTAEVTYKLDADRRTIWAEDEHRHRTLYTYEPGEERPSTITDESSGRALHLTWSADGERLVTVATDPVSVGSAAPAPVVWRYHYDEEDEDLLTSACVEGLAGGTACERYGYDDDGRLTTIDDREDERTTVAHDDEGRMTSITRPDAGMTSFAYSGTDDQVVTVTDPRGTVVTTTYDERYRLVGATGPDGTSQVAYDAHGYLQTATAPGDRELEITSDADGEPTSIRTEQALTQLGHDETSGQVDTVTTAGRQISTMTYDGFQRPASRTVPGTGLTWRWSYSQLDGATRAATTPAVGGGVVPWGLVVREQVPTTGTTEAGTTTHGYDAQGNRVLTELPTGVVITATYDELGRLTSRTTSPPTAEGIAPLPETTTTWEYDVLGNVVAETRPATVDAATDEAHQVRVETTYDALGRPTRVVEDDVLGSTPSRERSTTYDAAGRVLTETVPVDGSRSALTTHAYDATGNEVETVDAEGTVRRRTFDAAGRVLVEQVDGAVVATYERDAAGRVLRSTDALNRATTYDYDDAGRLVRTTRRLVDLGTGAVEDVVVEELVYGTQGDLQSRVQADGTLRTNYDYDAAGRLLQEWFDPSGLNRLTRYEYDDGGRVSRVARSGGTGSAEASEATETVFDPYGRVATETVVNGADDLVTAYAYDPLGRQVTVTGPEGDVTATAYDDLGRVTATTEEAVEIDGGGTADAVTTYGRDAFGQVTALVDPLGNTTTHEYNAVGWKVGTTAPAVAPPGGGAPLVPTTEYEHDLLGRVVRTVSPGGGVSERGYDALGRLTTSSRPGPSGSPAVTTNEYDEAGRLVEVTDPTGLVTTTTYDGLDRPLTSTQVVPAVGGGDPLELVTTTIHDVAGNLVTSIDPEGGTTTSTYDAAGELLTQVSPWQHEQGTDLPTTYERDGLGRLIGTTDPAGAATETTYDGAGRVVGEAVFDGTDWLRTVRTIDGNGNVLTETSPAGRVTTYENGADGRLLSVTEAPGGSVPAITTTFGYDVAGNRVRTTDGRGGSTTTTYNAWGLPETLVEPPTEVPDDPADRTWTTTYDVQGREVVRTEPGGITVTSAYDAAGNLTAEAGVSTDPAVPDATRTLTYDVGGRIVTAGVPGGTATYAYDARGLLVAQSGAGGTVDHLRYDRSGRLVEREDGRGTATYAYGEAGLLASMADPVSGRTFTYSYDAAGRRTGEVATTPDFVAGPEGAGDRQVTTWDHDAAGRVVGAEVLGPDGEVRRSETVAYDDDGLRTGRTVAVGAEAPVVDVYTYDGAGRLTAYTDEGSPEPVTMGWDAAGNVVQVDTAGLVYDARNRMTGVTEGGVTNMAVASSPRGDRTELAFAGELEEGEEPRPPLEMGYDALGRQISAAGVTYAWDSRGRVASRTEGEETESFSYVGGDLDPASVGDVERGVGPDGEVVSVDDEVVTLDGHNDIVAATGPDGTVTTTAYAPFGNALSGVPGAGPFGFQGDYTDPTVGTVWMGARVFQPYLGTFTSRDTWSGIASDPVTLNRYTYGNADPINHWDPTGHYATGPPREVVQAAATLATFLPMLTAATPVVARFPGAALALSMVMITVATALVVILNHRYSKPVEDVDEPTVVIGPVPPDPPELYRWCPGPGGMPIAVSANEPCPTLPDPGVDPTPGVDDPPTEPVEPGDCRGVDRGDGRDCCGQFVGGDSQPWLDKEAQALDEYEMVNGVTVERRKVGARLPGRPIRFYDGLVLDEVSKVAKGIEVKSGSATKCEQQRDFDDAVNGGSPATVTIDGVTFEIREVIDLQVP